MAGRKMVYGDTQRVEPVWFNIIMTGTITSLYPSQRNPCFSSLDQLFSKYGHLKQQHHSILLGDVFCVCAYTHQVYVCIYTHTYLYIVCIYMILMHIRDHTALDENQLKLCKILLF